MCASGEEEYCSKHNSSIEIVIKIEDESSKSTNDFYIAKNKVTKWKK